MSESLTIKWYGRCCFLLEREGRRVLFDPYDLFCMVDIGLIEADILLSSSSWHDHGHVGASPGAWIYSYPGKYENGEILITGIEAKEDRGTPTVVFNVRWGKFSVTNFADMGPVEDEFIEKNMSEEERKILATTNIALMRPMIKGREIAGLNVHNENALKYCSANIVFPEHYLPLSFIEEEVEENKKDGFSEVYQIVEELPEALGYPVRKIDDFQVTVTEADLRNKQIFEFARLHPQVKYMKDLTVVQKW